MREIETLITKKHLSNRNEEHVADVGYTFKSKGRGESSIGKTEVFGKYNHQAYLFLYFKDFNSVNIWFDRSTYVISVIVLLCLLESMLSIPKILTYWTPSFTSMTMK